VLIRQYRHGVGQFLWELPAGARDAPGEPPGEAAARELAEETDLLAGSVSPLIALHPSPGISDEFVQIFLARDLTDVPVAQRYPRTQEEAEISVVRFAVADAVAMVLRGEITNATAMVGILAYAATRR
jgi:ADP-ribose pyrophosphatase